MRFGSGVRRTSLTRKAVGESVCDQELHRQELFTASERIGAALLPRITRIRCIISFGTFSPSNSATLCPWSPRWIHAYARRWLFPMLNENRRSRDSAQSSEIAPSGSQDNSGGGISRGSAQRKAFKQFAASAFASGSAASERSLQLITCTCHGSSRPPFISWHDSMHEFVKQRHRERRITVARAPNHPFRNQLVPCRTE